MMIVHLRPSSSPLLPILGGYRCKPVDFDTFGPVGVFVRLCRWSLVACFADHMPQDTSSLGCAGKDTIPTPIPVPSEIEHEEMVTAICSGSTPAADS